MVHAYNHSFIAVFKEHRLELHPIQNLKWHAIFMDRNAKQNHSLFKWVIVRINKTKKTFDKGYLPNWTTELFKVTSIRHSSPPTVKLEDLGGEAIEGSFYLPEIYPIKDSEIFEFSQFLHDAQEKYAENRSGK
jgi:hypothetical protein